MYRMARKFTVMLLIINMAGCTTWTATHAPLGDMMGRRVRVTTRDGERIAGRLVTTDSLGVAIVHCPYEKPRDFAIDTAAVVFVEQRQFSPERTLGLAAALTVVTIACISIYEYYTDWRDAWDLSRER